MWGNKGDIPIALAPGPTISGIMLFSGLAAIIAGTTAVWLLWALHANTTSHHEDLLRPFAAVTAVTAMGALAVPLVEQLLRAGVLSIVPLVVFLLVFVPWNLFAFRYAGRGNLVTRRRIMAMGVVVAGLLTVYIAVAAEIIHPSQEIYPSVLLAASTGLLGLVALTFVSSGLVLTETYRHKNMSVTGGLTVVFPVAMLVIGIQVVSLSDFLTRGLLAAVHLLAVAAVLPLAVLRYDVLTTRPGTTTLGERTVVQDLNEPVLVVDTDGKVIRSNQQARALFGTDIDGQSLITVIETDMTTLRETSTIECWTQRGHKRFDPRLSTVTGHKNRHLGQAVTLIDVTHREMLRQRVQVLNRIFRHNIRNNLDVIKSHAEFARETGDDDAAAQSINHIINISDDIAQMSADARQIERLTRTASIGQSTVALRSLVEQVIETTTQDRPEVTTIVDIPDIELLLNRQLLRVALRNLVDNAIEHNDSQTPRVEVTGCRRDQGVRITITDNGPGIPDTEWQVIESGHEEAHAHLTSLGLWSTKWAVQKLGGDLLRRETDRGAAVVIDLPAQSPTANRRSSST